MQRTSSSILQISLACALLWLAACGKKEGAGDESACFQNSDCKDGLLCALGRCRLPCSESSDCGEGGSCITDGVQAVCQSLEEKDTPCNYQKDCIEPLACASDYRCRNVCETDDDCNNFGITGRRCAEDMRGRRYCAEPDEVRDGLLIATPPKGAKGPTRTPEDASTQDAGKEDPGGAAPKDALDGGKHAGEGDGDGDAGPDTGVGGDGDGGPGPTNPEPEPVCESACGLGNGCVEGACSSACGGVGQPCCEGSCGENPQCSAGSCSCVLSCAGHFALKRDGTVLNYAGMTVKGDNGEELRLRQLSAGSIGGDWLACGAGQDGSAWCWGTGNSAGQLGNGSTGASAQTAIRVRTAVDGPFLEDVEAVFVDERTLSAACAVTKGGKAWCWGDNYQGKLGDGTANDRTFAAPVLTAAEGEQFADVRAFALGWGHTCALKADHTLWCWGYNNFGELGVGAGSGIVYPKNVGSLGSTVAQVSVAKYRSCAVTLDSGLYCWGNSVGNTPQPMRGLDGLDPLLGAQRVQAAQQQACALTEAGNSVLCWVFNSTSSWKMATELQVQGVALTGAKDLCVGKGSGFGFVTADDHWYFNESDTAGLACAE